MFTVTALLLAFFLLPEHDFTSAFHPFHRSLSRQYQPAVSLDKRHSMIWHKSLTPSSTPRLRNNPSLQEKETLSIPSLKKSIASGTDTMTTTTTCWNPPLRRAMGALALVGVVETAYLCYTHGTGTTPFFCPVDGHCTSVLNGPYSTIPGTDPPLPLAALGLLAYSTTAFLALSPLLASTQNRQNNDNRDQLSPFDNEEEVKNRILLIALTTTMGVFSVFLMSILIWVLQENCSYCIASAIISMTLAKVSWFGGVLPARRKDGAVLSAGGAVVALAAAVLLFVNGGQTVPMASASTMSDNTVLVASTTSALTGQAPPPISTISSSRALELANQLQSLDAHFYGAYWCSHCYDQKETLGKQAMAKIPYIECSREGLNSQSDLCKSRKIPGYPTWEIAGKLYPGERALEELEEIVQKLRN